MINTSDQLLDAFYEQRDIHAKIAPISSISWEIGGLSLMKVMAMTLGNGQRAYGMSYYVKEGRQHAQDTLLGYPVYIVGEDRITIIFEFKDMVHTQKKVEL